jgi:hypothetical protein
MKENKVDVIDRYLTTVYFRSLITSLPYLDFKKKEENKK